jgi:hypothetical protein
MVPPPPAGAKSGKTRVTRSGVTETPPSLCATHGDRNKEGMHRKPAHTSPKLTTLYTVQGAVAQCAGKIEYVLDVLTAHQEHQERWNRSPLQPCASLYMLADWGRLWSGLGCGLWSGFGLLILWYKTAISKILP